MRKLGITLLSLLLLAGCSSNEKHESKDVSTNETTVESSVEESSEKVAESTESSETTESTNTTVGVQLNPRAAVAGDNDLISDNIETIKQWIEKLHTFTDGTMTHYDEIKTALNGYNVEVDDETVMGPFSLFTDQSDFQLVGISVQSSMVRNTDDTYTIVVTTRTASMYRDAMSGTSAQNALRNGQFEGSDSTAVYEINFTDEAKKHARLTRNTSTQWW